jgi:hypothetical protein
MATRMVGSRLSFDPGARALFGAYPKAPNTDRTHRLGDFCRCGVCCSCLLGELVEASEELLYSQLATSISDLATKARNPCGCPLLLLSEEIEIGVSAGTRVDHVGKISRKVVGVPACNKRKGKREF